MQRENARTDSILIQSRIPQFTGKGIFQSPMSMMLPFPADISAENRDKQGALREGFQGEDMFSLLDTAEMWHCSQRAGPWTGQ